MMSPPGWYPDPWAPGHMRWWSGRDWTSYTMPAGAGIPSPSRPTDGFAIASLITSIVGFSPVGIVLGLVAKRRIRNADGARGGDGLATAGIAIGAVFLTTTAAVVVLAVSGVFDEVNEDDYSGEEARVARVVDRFEEAYESLDGTTICRELFTSDLAGDYAADGGCEKVWNDGDSGYAEIDIQSIEVFSDSAEVVADDENTDDDWNFKLERNLDGEWHIYALE